MSQRQAGRSAKVEQRDAVTKVVEGKPRKLIETVAQEVVDLILFSFPLVDAVTVRVWKKPAVLPKLGRAAAEISRKR